MNNLGVIHGQWDVKPAETYYEYFARTGMLLFDLMYRNELNTLQFLSKPEEIEENPWHNITKQNEQYEWKF